MFGLLTTQEDYGKDSEAKGTRESCTPENKASGESESATRTGIPATERTCTQTERKATSENCRSELSDTSGLAHDAKADVYSREDFTKERHSQLLRVLGQLAQQAKTSTHDGSSEEGGS